MRCRVRGGSPNKWISKALEKTVPGRFSGKANKTGMSTSKFACHVLSHKGSYDVQTRREAQMFVNMNKSRRCSIAGGHSKLKYYELVNGDMYTFTGREINPSTKEKGPLQLYDGIYIGNNNKDILQFFAIDRTILYIYADENTWFKHVVIGGHSKLKYYELRSGVKYHFTAREIIGGFDDARGPLKIYIATFMNKTDRNVLKFRENSGRIFYVDEDDNIWFKPV